MRKYLRTGVIAVAAVATLGAGAAGAMASDQPATPTASVAKQSGKRAFVKTVKLRGGMTAKVYKLSGKGFQADIWLGKAKLGTITAIDKAAVTVNDGAVVKLTPDGTVTSWKYTGAGADKPVTKNQPNLHKDNNLSRPGKPAVKPGKPSVKPKKEICPPGPTTKAKPEICPPGPTPEICPPGPKADPATQPQVLPGHVLPSGDTADQLVN